LSNQRTTRPRSEITVRIIAESNSISYEKMK
jgi:hypothetical protein